MSIPMNMDSSEANTYITAITCDQMKGAEEYIREYILAWLDKAMSNDNSAFDVSLGLMHTVQQVFTFNDGQKCLDYLRSVTDKRAFLVLSYAIDDWLLNELLALPHLEYIYFFGREAILKKEHSKLVEITSIHDLYKHLNKDARSSNEEDHDTDFASLELHSSVKSIQELDYARTFIFYQFIIEVLLRLPKTNEIKEQFICFCMENTDDNPTQTKIFEEFIKSYKPDEAIALYSSTSCLHRLLNRTCRLGNLKDMFRLAFYMTDLYAQLKQLHQEQFDWTQERVLVYRGRRMPLAEFEKLKASIGDLVVTKSFLSTTTERDVAVMYSGKDTLDPNIVPAIIHMRIDKQKNETKPFAFIRYHSKVREDDEVLISIGIIFRIIEEKYKVFSLF
ncbi:unnamed protein product [Rotaria sp. Silwood1]|nr:unnamed protein product [Rotaria sp. Silwood1]